MLIFSHSREVQEKKKKKETVITDDEVVWSVPWDQCLATKYFLAVFFTDNSSKKKISTRAINLLIVTQLTDGEGTRPHPHCLWELQPHPGWTNMSRDYTTQLLTNGHW